MNKNEKKASEIANEMYMPDTGFDRYDIEWCCIDMAQWKDECFQSVIDRVKDTYQLDGSALFICDLIETRYKEKFK